MINLYKSNLIKKQVFTIKRFSSETIDDNGFRVKSRGNDEEGSGIVQFVPKNVYQEFGLDFTKVYLTIHTDKQLACVDRGSDGDIITYLGVDYLAKSDTQADKYGFRVVTAVRL